MASLSVSADGAKRVIAKVAGTRRAIHLGRLERRQAEVVRSYVARLEAAQQTGSGVDSDVAGWLSRISDELHDKLARVGLVPKRQGGKADTIGAFLEAYLASRAIDKPNTARNYGQTKRYLLDHFGQDRPLASITPGDADRFKEALIKAPLSPATVSREVKRARQFFRQAVRDKRIPENPFAEVKGGKQENEERFFFVTREMAGKVLEACPDCEWRLIFALARYGGLRCPSEHLAIKWTDLDWERNRMRVDAPKTGVRWVPIFPELLPYLLEASEQAPEGAVYVVQRCRDGKVNLRTQLERIIGRAGLEPWPKLFQNLRSTRETELMETFPAHVVCKWIGNSEAVARRHYLQVTDEHFERAAGGGVETTRQTTRAAHVSLRIGQSKKQQTPVNPETYEGLPYCTCAPVPPRGVEPLSSD